MRLLCRMLIKIYLKQERRTLVRLTVNLTDIFSNHFVSDLKRIINLADELDDKY